MGKILLIATTNLTTDGLTRILIRIAEEAASMAQIGIALSEGCDKSVAEELIKYGQLYYLPSRKKMLPLYLFSLRKLVAKEKYKAVHIHGNSATMAFDLMAAWLGGAEIRITHTHNCAPQSPLKQHTLGRILNSLVTCPVACSEAAGTMLYTKPYLVLTNGVDCECFRFLPEKRSSIRERLNIGDAFVVGHIGRFSQQKNHHRLLGIFAALLQIRPNSVLLLCGEGEKMEQCKRETLELNIAEKVIFAGNVERPQDYYQAMDVFVLPSLFEGLPLVGVEAQASGLPCVFSDAITREAKILPECVFLPLQAQDAVWADMIGKIQTPCRESAVEAVKKAGFSHLVLREQIRKLYSKV